ncbi:MAG TPA: FecR domain-containing protein [Bacteriovoracaceae bacterium]|nr:FecR domain-containing protein [Bacteriovoracaceae bacterium]
MKTFRTKLKISLTVALTLGVLNVWAKPIAQIQDVKGLAFVITPTGNTKKIKANDLIEERAELLVEEGTQISLNDYYNTTYHLTGGTHVKFFDRSIQLKKGKTWVKAKSRVPLSMTTANGNVEYTGGQFIATFDQASNRSQILVVQGHVDVTNILDKDLRYTVDQGNFTVIDPEVDNGLPRVPTKVGMASLNSALKEFEMSATPMTTSRPSRSLASVRPLETPMEVKKGEIIFMTSSKLPRVVGEKSSKRAPASVVPKKTVTSWGPAEISYYGQKQEHPKIFSRNPASTSQSEVQVDNTLKKASEVRPVYSNELESLVNELKSY